MIWHENVKQNGVQYLTVYMENNAILFAIEINRYAMLYGVTSQKKMQSTVPKFGHKPMII